MKFTITAYSTALFSTWINVEELNVLIDAGDGLSAGLLQKSRKIKYAFITHPDRDHLLGIPQFLQLNARDDFPKIYFPKDSGSFPAMRDFLEQFDPHVALSSWNGIEHASRVTIRKNMQVEAIRNEHIPAPHGTHKSFSYKVFEFKNKLKPEFQSYTPEEIKSIVQTHGKEFLTERIESNILSFSGDTPVDDYSRWEGSQILFHEATFLNEGKKPVKQKGNRHSRLDEVLQMVKEIDIGTLILHHFSSRYSKEEIQHSVLKLLDDLKIQIPVYVIYPGQIQRDILQTQPINA